MCFFYFFSWRGFISSLVPFSGEQTCSKSPKDTKILSLCVFFWVFFPHGVKLWGGFLFSFCCACCALDFFWQQKSVLLPTAGNWCSCLYLPGDLEEEDPGQIPRTPTLYVFFILTRGLPNKKKFDLFYSFSAFLLLFCRPRTPLHLLGAMWYFLCCVFFFSHVCLFSLCKGFSTLISGTSRRRRTTWNAHNAKSSRWVPSLHVCVFLLQIRDIF